MQLVSRVQPPLVPRHVLLSSVPQRCWAARPAPPRPAATGCFQNSLQGRAWSWTSASSEYQKACLGSVKCVLSARLGSAGKKQTVENMPSLTFHHCLNITASCSVPVSAAPQPFPALTLAPLFCFSHQREPAAFLLCCGSFACLQRNPRAPAVHEQPPNGSWFKAILFFLQIQNVQGTWISKVATGTSRQSPAHSSSISGSAAGHACPAWVKELGAGLGKKRSELPGADIWLLERAEKWQRLWEDKWIFQF